MLTIPREICCNLDQALSREWLVTNGLGGYASSSISGTNTRRYHGLLVAALYPPSGRTVLVSKLDEEIEVNGATYRLGTNEYDTGTINPEGYLFLDRVVLEGMIPTFHYRSASFALSKTVWMEYVKNTTFVRYYLEAKSLPIQLTLLPLCTYRDAHREMRGSIDWHWHVQATDASIELRAFADAYPYRISACPKADYVPLDLWYWKFKHRIEQERGLDYVEDLYLPGLLRRVLQPGESLCCMLTTEPFAPEEVDSASSLEREKSRQRALLVHTSDEFERQLVLAADQFVVRRKVKERSLHTVIAGYHWFSDWGRDTMIALEGLTLATGRTGEAADILRAFAQYVDQGMLPNRFPDVQAKAATQPVEYNTVDATLWYFHAIDRYLAVTQDQALLEELFPVLVSIVKWHIKGTRHRIHVDPGDGLLAAGEAGVQLTWMDAKADDWVVTPRIGKPVEINALWYHALRIMEKQARRLHQPFERYCDLADMARSSFEKFWFAEGGYLYDVIDGPAGNDSSLRPNQLFALSLEEDLVPDEQARSILQVVERELLTPVGLRTLSPRDSQYHYSYRGNQRERDAAYHQGIVWEWLIGAYADARMRVDPDHGSLCRILRRMETLFSLAGIGSLSEIHEAQPPFRPVGCIAQAWSVAEVLRAYKKARGC